MGEGLWQYGKPPVSGDHPLGKICGAKFLADSWLMDNLNGMRDFELLLEVNQTRARAQL